MGKKKIDRIIAGLPRDDTARITSDYKPSRLEVEVCRQAICREFGNNGTDGYYIRILKAIHSVDPSRMRGEHNTSNRGE